MARFSLAPSFHVAPPISGREFATHVQRLCGHYERIYLPAVPGVFDTLAAERRQACAACQLIVRDEVQLALRPRLRIVCEHAVWGVERLMNTTRGIGWHVVAFLTSHEQCMQWISATFQGRPYQIVDDTSITVV